MADVVEGGEDNGWADMVEDSGLADGKAGVAKKDTGDGKASGPGNL